ncbi:MAG TPA: PA2779 family protein [Thermoanaerobaculia bacterium]
MKHLKAIAFAIGILVMFVAVPAFAGPVPSKTAPNQSLEARQADLSTVKDVLEIDGVAKALEAQGFTRAEVETRVAALSDEDLSSLAQNLEQVQAAGLTNEQWLWMGLGALIVLLIIVL